MNKFPELTEDVQTYAAYLPQITEAQSAYRNYADGIRKWFADAYNAQEQELKITNIYAKNYVLGKPGWDKLEFHIEILWEGELAFAGKLTLEAHIEKNKDQHSPKAMLIKEVFGLNDIQRSHGNPLLVGSVDCDLSTEEKALDSLQKLNEALRSFRDLSEKADECLKRLPD